VNNVSASPLIPLLKIKIREKGKIKDIRDIVARVEGLPTCLNGQLVEMGEGVQGIIMGFDQDSAVVLVLGDAGKLRMGQEVRGISEPFKIPVGEKFIGRMVDGLGRPCDDGDPIEASDSYAIFRPSPPLIDRAPSNEFFQTGTKMVDVITPLAKGQRQLILGDRLTGKTVIGVDAILNQKGKNCVCIYCCIGKSLSNLEKVLSTLQGAGAFEYTIVMVATDNAPVGEQYMVPFCAASMGEYFVSMGRDVLVVFDDLTKHAWAYRELSLLMDRPPGREAYPGDIFYVQTQLMERGGKFNQKRGGGTMTFLGIAETLQGDMTGYVPSNLASMCDGQIVLSSSVFAEGLRPAMDFLLSMSILGVRVQPPALRALGMELRADYARYTEVLRLSKLQSTISDEAAKTLNKGRAMTSLLQQMQNRPACMGEQVVLLYALHMGLVATLSADVQKSFRGRIGDYVMAHDASLFEDIEVKPELTPTLEGRLERVIRGCLEDLGRSEGGDAAK
jgi:F-type H+/Na+-transporting ATPase subunit alpha